MSTLVCCELSRAKQVAVRDARFRWDLIGANCECYYSGVFSTFPYSGRSVTRQQLLATYLRVDSRAPLGVGNFCAPDLLLAKSGFFGLNNIIHGRKSHSTTEGDRRLCGIVIAFSRCRRLSFCLRGSNIACVSPSSESKSRSCIRIEVPSSASVASIKEDDAKQGSMSRRLRDRLSVNGLQDSLHKFLFFCGEAESPAIQRPLARLHFIKG